MKPTPVLNLLCLILLTCSCSSPSVSKEHKSNHTAQKNKEDQETKICTNTDFDIEQHVNSFSQQIEDQEIVYNSEPLSDCSGMFIRLCKATQEQCPKSTFPNTKTNRSTRAIARWYYEQDNLTLIEDASSAGELIRPGAVLFYGKGGKKFKNITIDMLTVSGGIEHVGTVTAVQKNTAGKVVSYTLFHGRSSGKIATRTNYHELKPKRKELPPFGNWNQQLVAIAYLLTPEK